MCQSMGHDRKDLMAAELALHEPHPTYLDHLCSVNYGPRSITAALMADPAAWQLGASGKRDVSLRPPLTSKVP